MPRIRRALHLHEEILLLALRNDRGTIAGGVMYEQAAGGAILAELILEQRVRIVLEGRSSYAEVQESRPLGDPVLDESLQLMIAATRRATLQKWAAGDRRRACCRRRSGHDPDGRAGRSLTSGVFSAHSNHPSSRLAG